MTQLLAYGGVPWWLSWGETAWTAGDATVAAAVWFTVAVYLWGAGILALLGYLIADETPEPDFAAYVSVFWMFGVLLWPLVLGVELVAAVGCAIVMPTRAAVHRRRRRQRERHEATELRRERIAELERDLEIER